MDRSLSYFVYRPPKSNSHGHGVRDNNVRRATQKVIDSFVDAFNATPNKELQLTLYYDINELHNAQRVRRKLNEFLGLAKREWDNLGYEHMRNSITWESSEKNIFDLLDYIDKLKDESFLPLSNYWMHCFYHYGNNNEANGYIMCSIESGRLFVRLNLIIPNSIDSGKPYELLSKFQASLPFKLNSKHFRRLGPSKNGYGQWKLDAETQNRLDTCLVKYRIKK